MSEFRGCKFVTALVLEFKEIESYDKAKSFYSSSKAGTVISESDIDDAFESVYVMIISNIQISLGKGFGWIIDYVVDLTVNIAKYKPLSGSSYIKLPKELDHPK